MSSSDDEYIQCAIGTALPRPEELSNLYTDSNSPKSPKKPPRQQKGVAVLPAIKPKPRATESYSPTQPSRVKSKVFKKRDSDAGRVTSPSAVSPKALPRRQVSNGSVADRKASPSSQGGDDDNIYEHMDPAIVPGELALDDFAKRFSQSLPQQIVVSKGVYGNDDETTLSTSDICNIHCIKRRDLVKVEEKGSKQNYSIPLNSAIKFAPVFNHHENLEEITKGERFPFVSNLLDLVIMPKVVCACQPYDSSHAESGEVKEILAIKEVVHPESAAQRRKLRVYSFTDRDDKILDESLYGDFSTRPSDIKLYMSDILKHVTSPFPMHLLMFRDTRLTKMLGLPQHLYRYPLLMTKKFTEVVLIATSGHPGSGTIMEPFEIPTELDIDIQLVKLPDKQQDILVKKTEDLKQQLETTTVKIYKYENMSEESFRAQTKLYELVRLDNGLEEPRGMKQSAAKKSLLHRIEKLERSSEKYTGDQTRVQSDREAHERFKQTALDKMAEQDKLLSQQATQLRTAMKQISALKQQLGKLMKMVHGIEEDDSLSEKIEDFQYDDPRPEDSQGESDLRVKTKTRSREEENKKKLVTLNTQQLVKLLDQSGLSQYITTFTTEGITGELLLECDAEVLKNELGVASKLHQIKLMKIINGQADIL